MMKPTLGLACAVLGSILLVPVATLQAQQFPFDLRVRADDRVSTVANGSSLGFGVDAVGEISTATVDVTYRGQTEAEFTGRPQLIGSSAFTFGLSKQAPITLKPNESFSVTMTFKSTSPVEAQALFAWSFVQAPATPSAPAQIGAIQLQLRGLTPNVVASYALATTGNVLRLTDGGSLVFDPTTAGQTARAVVQIANTGSGAGSIESVSVTGGQFRVLGLALLPISLAPGNALQFDLRYSPESVGEHRGRIDIQIGDSTTISAELIGSAVGSAFTYELIQETVAQPILPGQPVMLESTPVGEERSATILVQNNGSAEGSIDAIAVSGVAFSVQDLPFLPAELAPGDTLTFTLRLRPTEPGQQSGRLRIGSVIFDLAALGLGPDLLYTFSSGGSSEPLPGGGTAFFSPTPIGSVSQATFAVRNIGSREILVPSIGISGARAGFQLSGLPLLPLTLKPEESVEFGVRFAPIDGELGTARLLLGDAQFVLSGFGSEPEDLPEYRLNVPGGNLELLTQSTISLTLVDPYPVALSGALVLQADTGELADDPAVQFATGGRTVAFRIPANTTKAIFVTGDDAAAFQSGSVATTLRFRPTFATDAGFDLTPQDPLTLSLSAPAVAPAVRTLLAQRTGANSFQIVVVGHTSTRSLTKMQVMLTPVEGSNVKATVFEFDLGPSSTLWFESQTSRSFGGQFSVVTPFVAEGQVLPADLGLSSVSVTVSNGLGNSPAVSTSQF